MEQPPFSLRPSPWVLLPTAALILVFVGVGLASSAHPPWGAVAGLCAGAVLFIGLAVLVARRRL